MKKIGIFNFRVTDRVQTDMTRSTRLVILIKHRSTRLVILINTDLASDPDQEYAYILYGVGNSSSTCSYFPTNLNILLLYE